MILKFRAWHKKYKKMYRVQDLHMAHVMNGGIWATVDGHDPIEDKNIYIQIQPKDIEVMQYTGLKDKNGKDIYEGDLFGKFGGDKERPGEYEIHGQIKFDTDFAMFVIELTNGGWMELFDYMNNRQNQREIIGNIYENSELLK